MAQSIDEPIKIRAKWMKMLGQECQRRMSLSIIDCQTRPEDCLAKIGLNLVTVSHFLKQTHKPLLEDVGVPAERAIRSSHFQILISQTLVQLQYRTTGRGHRPVPAPLGGRLDLFGVLGKFSENFSDSSGLASWWQSRILTQATTLRMYLLVWLRDSSYCS